MDMKTTLRNKFGRVKVVVMNPKIIPKVISVVIGTRWYDVRFEVEENIDESKAVDMEEDNDEDSNGRDDSGSYVQKQARN